MISSFVEQKQANGVICEEHIRCNKEDCIFISFYFGPHQWCSGLAPTTELRDHFCQCPRGAMGKQDWTWAGNLQGKYTPAHCISSPIKMILLVVKYIACLQDASFPWVTWISVCFVFSLLDIFPQRHLYNEKLLK